MDLGQCFRLVEGIDEVGFARDGENHACALIVIAVIDMDCVTLKRFTPKHKAIIAFDDHLAVGVVNQLIVTR